MNPMIAIKAVRTDTKRKTYRLMLDKKRQLKDEHWTRCAVNQLCICVSQEQVDSFHVENMSGSYLYFVYGK